MVLTPGTHLGPYEILAPLGAGGMGEVFRARDTKLKRDVALKVLPEAFARDPERMARFQREAEVLASLNHPNIAHIYGVEDQALVMELVEGESPKGPLPFDDAWRIALQIADALEYAHDKGVIHRDLKPANVKVTPQGVVKLLDFGLAKALSNQITGAPDSSPANSPTMTLGATMAGTIMGTAAYMAPEQAKGKSVDKRADIWAWGVVLYELLTGELLFKGEDAADTLAHVLTQQPSLDKTAPQTRKLLQRCLEKDPKQRLRDIGEARFLLDEETAASAPPSSRLRWVPWAVAGLFLAVAASVSFLHFREAPPPEAPTLRAFLPPPERTAYNIRGGLGTASAPAISPDGRRFIFSAVSEDGKNQLWVRSFDALTAQPLAGTQGGSHPFWSPDSKFVGFFAGGKLKKIDASGGTAIALCDVQSGRGGTWNRDGVIVFADLGIRRVPSAGGTPTSLTALTPDTSEAKGASETNGGYTTRWPSFLPDGNHFLYLSNTGKAGGSIRVGALDSKDEGPVVADTISNVVFVQGNLLYLREDTLVAQPFDLKRLATTGEAIPISESVESVGNGRVGIFSASESGLVVYLPGQGRGDLKLTWFDRTGRRLGTVGDAGILVEPVFSPDRKTIAVSAVDPASQNQDIWLYDVTRGLRTRLTFDPARDRYPVWSPDGANIVFSRTQAGKTGLYRRSSDGSGAEESLYDDKLNNSANSISPDGKFLLYTASGDPKTRADLMVLPLSTKGAEAKPKPFPFLQTVSNEGSGQFSPDGRWVAYQSAESGRNEVYVAPFKGPGGFSGGRRQISAAGGLQPRWRPDGKEIFYIDPGGRLMAAGVGVKGTSFDVGAVTPLFSGQDLNSSYDVSPDGQKFIALDEPQQEAGRALVLVQNWAAGLKK